jgi:GTP cyclohydrolase IA
VAASARARAAGAVARFLDALGLPRAVRRSAELAQTPARVAQAWLDELLDGYRQDPAAVLSPASASPARDLVALTGITYQSMCPHHLLPSRGVAHVAYLPGGRVAGFGQVVRLVDALAHRLVLQEDLARDVARALVDHLGARGAACVLDAEHLCLTARGARRVGTRAHSEAFVGALARDGEARRRFLAAIGGGAGRTAARGGGRARGPARARVRPGSGRGGRR